MNHFKFSIAAVLFLFVETNAHSDDWPQWMGANRNGSYSETGLVDSIPAEGLPVKWRVPIHGGYAGPAVAGGRVYLLDYRRTAGKLVEEPNAKPALEGFERILCFNAETGKEIWKHEYPCSYRISYPAGPRATTTVTDGEVYALGAQGNLTKLSADSGQVIWKKDLPREFSAKVPVWGFAAHPLVTKSTVITMVGGTNQSVVAFDRKTGEVVWKSLTSSDAGYCPPSIIQAGGTEQLLVWHPQAVSGLNPDDGKVYWTVPLEPDYGMSISHPVHSGDYLFVTGIVDKSIMLKLGGDSPTVTETWAATPKTSLSASTMTPVIHNGIIYGCDENLGAVVAAQVSDGKRLWNTREPVRPGAERRVSAGTAYITRHTPTGKFWLFGEEGHLTLAEMDRDGFKSLGQMKVVEPTQSAFGRKVIWSHPAYANKTAYIRNDKELVAVDLAK